MTISQPILNPKLPYIDAIEGGFAPGRMVRIQGRTLQNTQRFAINLQCGPNLMPRDDVGIHISVRVAESYVVFNTLENGAWGSEVAPRTRLPIGLAQNFEILILSDAGDYKVAINGQHFGDFPHRIPINLISHLTIDGDVEIALICYEDGAPEVPSEESRTPGLSYSGSQGSDDLDLKDFQPSGGRQGQFGPPGQRGNYGPPQSQYGPPQGQYGPPQGQYGPPHGQYGPPQGQYGPQGGQGYGPPPPGYYSPGGEPPKSEAPGLFEGFLGQAGTAIAGAIASNAINKIAGGGNQPPQQQPNFFGGGGGIGSGYPGQQSGGGPLSSLLGSLTSGGGGGGNQYGHPQQGGQSSGGGLGDFLSSALSSFSNPQRH